MDFNCRVCNKVIKLRPSYARDKTHRCKECYQQSARVNKLCLNCGKETKNAKFCSHSCSTITANKTKGKRIRQRYPNCAYCGKELISNTRKHCSQKCNGLHQQQERFAKIIEEGIIHPKGVFRNSYLAKGFVKYYRGYKCSICGISEWCNKPLMLILDHINGIPDDWNIENLRLVCSNCDSQLPTYKSKNKAGGRPSRRKSQLS